MLQSHETTTIIEVTTAITIARTRLSNNNNNSLRGQISVLHAGATVDVTFAAFMVIALVSAPIFTEIPTFTAPARPKKYPSVWQPHANMATALVYHASNWLLDSGLTHHLTSYLNNLLLHYQPYTGGVEVTTADGNGLQISHTHSPTSPRLHVEVLVVQLFFKLTLRNLLSNKQALHHTHQMYTSTLR
ncbi:Retrovirus-related Pol polyprotein from transposon RE2 [Cardamine amara subsp. amara]|uniref:Retrovirus-related Pol polyprotein from transposon RE2 n=1 Tax=Cardamine amara subsp. amara TaxID=228776 RepID=A0ABD0ZB80_CARAN